LFGEKFSLFWKRRAFGWICRRAQGGGEFGLNPSHRECAGRRDKNAAIRCWLAPRSFKKVAARASRSFSIEANRSRPREQGPPVPKFMLFLVHPGHGSERRGAGPPFQPNPPQKPLVSMYRSVRGCLIGSRTAGDCCRPKPASSRLRPSDVHDRRRPPFEYCQ